MRLMSAKNSEKTVDKHPEPRDRDDEDAPDTPPDEPQPAPVQDPPVEPVEPPYVVNRPSDRTAGAPTRVEP
jgi:hypothetical protein